MQRTTVSACHSLRLIPISMLTRFVRVESLVAMVMLGKAVDAGEVPGSVKRTVTTENGVLKGKITYECSDVSDAVAVTLQYLKATRLVAVYVDESGNTRVAGSPDLPLSLEYTDRDGVFAVTLEGEDTRPDGFLAC